MCSGAGESVTSARLPRTGTLPAVSRVLFDPAELERRDVYKLLIGLVVPRPIGWIGSVDGSGNRNLAPYSFFNAVGSAPPTVLFAPGSRPTGAKDSLANVEVTGEFSVNMVSHDLAEAMNLTSGTYPPEIDEFEVAGLTAVTGSKVAAPLVAEAPASMECVVSEIVRIGVPPTGSAVVFGTVVAFHVREDLLDGTRVDQEALDLIGRMGGPNYATTRDVFGMVRPP